MSCVTLTSSFLRLFGSRVSLRVSTDVISVPTVPWKRRWQMAGETEKRSRARPVSPTIAITSRVSWIGPQARW